MNGSAAVTDVHIHIVPTRKGELRYIGHSALARGQHLQGSDVGEANLRALRQMLDRGEGREAPWRPFLAEQWRYDHERQAHIARESVRAAFELHLADGKPPPDVLFVESMPDGRCALLREGSVIARRVLSALNDYRVLDERIHAEVIQECLEEYIENVLSGEVWSALQEIDEALFERWAHELEPEEQMAMLRQAVTETEATPIPENDHVYLDHDDLQRVIQRVRARLAGSASEPDADTPAPAP